MTTADIQSGFFDIDLLLFKMGFKPTLTTNEASFTVSVTVNNVTVSLSYVVEHAVYVVTQDCGDEMSTWTSQSFLLALSEFTATLARK